MPIQTNYWKGIIMSKDIWDDEHTKPIRSEVLAAASHVTRSQSNGASLDTILQNCELDHKTEYLKPPVVLSIEGQRIGTLGNFSLLIGKAKSRKTFFATAIAVAALTNSTFCGVTANLPEGKRRILYFDTEQSTYDCWAVLDRIVRAANLEPENLHFFTLRKFSPAERTDIIDHALKTISGLGLVLIDGTRDLVSNINSENESTVISSKLMRWTQEYNLHIVCVLHQNKADSNARGHVGTESINKGETVLSIVKDELNPDISIVSPEFSRAIDASRLAFSIDENGFPVLVSDYMFNPSGESLTDQEHVSIVQAIFEGIPNGLRYSELIKAIKDHAAAKGHKFGDNRCRDFITHYQNMGWITATGTEGTKQRRYTLNKDEYEDMLQF